MTRAFCQLSAAARLALPPVPPYERYRGIVHMTAAPDSPHRRAALMEAAGAAGLQLTSRVFWLGSEQATYGDRFQTARGRNIAAAAPARQASPQVPELTIHAASCDIDRPTRIGSRGIDRSRRGAASRGPWRPRIVS